MRHIRSLWLIGSFQWASLVAGLVQSYIGATRYLYTISIWCLHTYTSSIVITSHKNIEMIWWRRTVDLVFMCLSNVKPRWLCMPPGSSFSMSPEAAALQEDWVLAQYAIYIHCWIRLSYALISLVQSSGGAIKHRCIRWGVWWSVSDIPSVFSDRRLP